MKDAVSIAKEQGRKIVFKKASLGFKHPNQARIDVFAADGHKEFSVMTYSIGGGMFQITELDEFQVAIDGRFLYVVKPQKGSHWRKLP